MICGTRRFCFGGQPREVLLGGILASRLAAKKRDRKDAHHRSLQPVDHQGLQIRTTDPGATSIHAASLEDKRAVAQALPGSGTERAGVGCTHGSETTASCTRKLSTSDLRQSTRSLASNLELPYC